MRDVGGVIPQRLEFVHAEERAIGGIEAARFFRRLFFVEIDGAVAEWPILPRPHPLDQQLDGEKFIVSPLGIRHPGHKIFRLGHAHIVARLGEAESGNRAKGAGRLRVR